MSAASDSAARIARLRTWAWLLDDVIPLPGGFRIGLDPLIGLAPGLGDLIGAMLSLAIIVEATRIGVSKTVAARMLINVLIDALVGSIPIAGDLFDAGYKANRRNLELLERYHGDPIAAHHASRKFVVTSSALASLVALTLLAIPVLIVVAIVKLIGS
jgi:hypothetical protein